MNGRIHSPRVGKISFAMPSSDAARLIVMFVVKCQDIVATVLLERLTAHPIAELLPSLWLVLLAVHHAQKQGFLASTCGRERHLCVCDQLYRE